jgi:hypothetical protein
MFIDGPKLSQCVIKFTKALGRTGALGRASKA